MALDVLYLYWKDNMLYKFTRVELKTKKASEFKEGDIIKTGIYYIDDFINR